MSPISAPSHKTSPSTGDGNLHRRLVGHDGGEDRVLAHEVADLDVPLDELGLGDAFADVGQLDDDARPSSGLHVSTQRPTDAGRTGEIVPFLRVRIGRVPAGDARDRRFEMVEAVFLHQRRQLGAEARCQRRLVHDTQRPVLRTEASIVSSRAAPACAGR